MEKFILLLTDDNDVSSCEVLDWLNYYNEKYLVITDRRPIENITIESSGEFIFSVKNEVYNSASIKSFWFRRGKMNVKSNLNLEFSLDLNEDLLNYCKNFISAENNVIINYIYRYLFRLEISLSSLMTSSLNKIDTLIKAKSFGLNVPDFIITDSINKINNFASQHELIITKSLGNPFSYISEKASITSYTELVNKTFLDSKIGDCKVNCVNAA